MLRLFCRFNSSTRLRVSPFQTHHEDRFGNAVYEKKFVNVLNFHQPENLAAVLDHEHLSYHIDIDGKPAYQKRFKRTFGFYCGRAGVVNEKNQHYHILKDGFEAYKERWEWCGNFSNVFCTSSDSRCPVMDSSKQYFHIDELGKTRSGPHAYCGDFKYNVAIAWGFDGYPRLINVNGDDVNLMLDKNEKIIDLLLPHKGVVAVKTQRGWSFYQNDRKISKVFFRNVEMFYNGRAFVQLLSGEYAIVNENGEIVSTIPLSQGIFESDIKNISMGYFSSFALKMVLDGNILSSIERNIENNHLKKALLSFCLEMGWCIQSDGSVVLTETGKLLTKESITIDKAKYWLQDRYLHAWSDVCLNIDSMLKQEIVAPSHDTFVKLAKDPANLELSRRVLGSYAIEDWFGISCHLPLENVSTVVDLAGGSGMLLRELSHAVPSQTKLICMERPEIVELSKDLLPRVQYQVGDLFSGSLAAGDLYVMSRVLHDWDDVKAEDILKHVFMNASANINLCVIDRVVTDKTPHALLSLHMWCLQRAKERTQSEWELLFDRTGWNLVDQKQHSEHSIFILQRQLKPKYSHPSPAYQPVRHSSLTGITKAVVPIAGLATRMRPFSDVCPKALLPLVATDDDGKLSLVPALSILINQLINSSISQIYLVASKSQLQILLPYLSNLKVSEGNVVYSHGGDNKSFTSETREFLDGKVIVVIQDSPRGLGDAVLQARDFVADSSAFMVVLGDHCYESHVFKEIIQAFQLQSALVPIGKPIGLTGATTCSVSEVLHTGLLKLDGNIVQDMIEKPTYFDNFMLPNGRFYSQLGVDILPHTIFPLLQSHVGSNENNLRSAMKMIQTQGLLHAHVLDGANSDLGNPSSYVHTFAKVRPTMRIEPSRSNSNLIENNLLNWLSMQRIRGIDKNFLSSVIASAPGRIDLMGGFADYSGSKVLQSPINKRTYAIVSTNDSNEINLFSIFVPSIDEAVKGNMLIASIDSSSVWSKSFPTGILFSDKHNKIVNEVTFLQRLKDEVALADDKPNASSNWSWHIMGVIRALSAANNPFACKPFSGMNVVIVSDLPSNCGLASSASLQMSVALATNKVLQTNMNDLVSICQNVENNILGSLCGFMDHVAVGYGQENCLLSFKCQQPFLLESTNFVPIPSGLSVWALDTGVARSTANEYYNKARVGSLIGKSIINSSYNSSQIPVNDLCDMSPSQLNKVLKFLPNELSGFDFMAKNQEEYKAFLQATNSESMLGINPNWKYPVAAATLHPVEENFRANIFEGLLKSYGASDKFSSCLQMSELMSQSNLGYSACGLGCAEIDTLVDLINQNSVVKDPNGLFVGVKPSGAGCGGSVAVLAKNDPKLKSSLDNIANTYTHITGRQCRLIGGSSGKMTIHHQQREFSTVASSVEAPRVLLVNHGYPPDFNGGSEVYHQTLALNMLKSGKVASVDVFSREHDSFRPDFDIRVSKDHINPRLTVYLINYPREAPYAQFVSGQIDIKFKDLLKQLMPDVVHYGHLNHLSLNLPEISKAFGAKNVYTLHDFWLMCPRGQFLIVGPTSNEPWKQCTEQVDSKCASSCFASRFATGIYTTSSSSSSQSIFADNEVKYWTGWIGERMRMVRSVCDHSIDAFIAPSDHLKTRFINEFGLDAKKVLMLRYGFDLDRLSNRQRKIETKNLSASRPYVFGYIGRHQPSKGMNLLIEAANIIRNNNPEMSSVFKVIIFGRSDVSTPALRRMVAESGVTENIEWCHEYANENIVRDVFDHVDAIVVPSIWDENSPLVIQEAQQCKVPVITSNYGGMGELVKQAVNGLTFQHRNAASLAISMQAAIEQPFGMESLGNRGFLHKADQQVNSIVDHVSEVLSLYKRLLNNENPTAIVLRGKDDSVSFMEGPRRITFDTNPDDCNFSCTMCEQHSQHSPHQKERKAKGIRRRRMDFNLISDTVQESIKYKLQEIIPTTMGEPLQYKEFPRILDLCHEHNIKLNLTTNGSFWGRGVDAWAELIVPVSVDVKISWNGSTQETQERIMKGSNLMKQITNLRNFIAVRDRVFSSGGNYCSVTLQLTFLEDNLNEIPDIVRFAIKTGCDRVKGHQLWAHFDEISDQDLRRNLNSRQRWNVVAAECREIAANNLLSSGKRIILQNFVDLDVSRPIENTETSIGIVDDNLVCPFLGREAWINHDGRFDPCCAPDEKRKSLGSFGNIKETSLSEIWNSDAYKALVRDYKQKPLCRTCTMRILK